MPYKDSDSPQAIMSRKKRAARYYERNREKRIADSAKWKKENPERTKANRKRWNKAHPEYKRSKQKDYYKKYKQRILERSRARYQEQREKELRTCKRYRDTHKEQIRKYFKGRRAVDNERLKNYYRKQKQIVVDAYGGKCFCCGDTHFEFLTIDHINGGGRKDRAKKTGSGFYVRLVKEGFPKDKYRLACMNCNFALGKYGHCPHQAPL